MIRSWNEIVAHYRDLAEQKDSAQEMFRFVDQIAGSVHAKSLHAWTSMHDLCIVQVPGSYPYDGPHLRVSPYFDGTIEFRYVDTQIESRQWHRRVAESDAFGRLELFMDQLRWVAKESNHDPV